MNDKKIDPHAPINFYPDDPLWHEGCDRMLEAWVKECLLADDPYTTHSVKGGRLHISRNNPSRETLAQFTDGCRSALFSTPEGRNFVDGWVGCFLDEPSYLMKVVPDVKYLVKDPKEPYRRHPADRKWASRQVGTIGQVRLRLNGVTVSLFPFRNTVPQVSFTHPDRGYTMWSPTQTYYESGESKLHNIMLEGHLKAIQGHHSPIWGATR